MILLVRYLGYLCIISAFFRVIPIITAIYYAENFILFLVSFFLSIIVGVLLVIISRRMGRPSSSITLKNGFMLAALSFIVLPLIGAISFLPTFSYNVLDAFFESVSGFTTTGLTLYETLDELPKSLLMWRAETQWMGGIGIVMFFLFILTRFDGHKRTEISDAERIEKTTKTSMALYKAQGFSEKLEAGFRRTLRNVMIIYLGYTVLGTAFLFLSGLNLFESVSMTFTALSTGGFSVNDSFYSGNFQLTILCILMIIGSISFISHNKLIQRKFKEFIITYEKNILLLFIFIAFGLAFLFTGDFRMSAFEIISAFTTTGYSISEIALLPQLVILLIVIGMMVGGCTASTSGGIKVDRIYSLIRSIPWFIKKRSSPPKSVIPFRIHDKLVELNKLQGIGIFVFVYIFFLVLGTIIFMLFGYSFLDSSFQIVSGLGTVGLQTMALASIHAFLKVILILSMIFGRLEIFPLLIVLRQFFKK
jgi:trk system potassium uptake protein TrkH